MPSLLDVVELRCMGEKTITAKAYKWLLAVSSRVLIGQWQ